MSNVEAAHGVDSTFSRDHVFTSKRTDVTKDLVQVGRGKVNTPEQGALLLAAALFGRCLQPPRWHESAACRDMDPELFEARTAGPAVTVCQDCPVADLCRTDQLRWERNSFPRTDRRAALATVRGGLTSGQRVELHHQRLTQSATSNSTSTPTTDNGAATAATA